MFLRIGTRLAQYAASAGLLAIISCAAAAQQSSLSGVVTDSEGAAIGHAQVYIHWDPSGSGVGLRTNVGITQNRIITVNRAGNFQVALPPGFYDIFISAPAFSPECRKLRIRPGERAHYDARLTADPGVTKELGDVASH